MDGNVDPWDGVSRSSFLKLSLHPHFSCASLMVCTVEESDYESGGFHDSLAVSLALDTSSLTSSA